MDVFRRFGRERWLAALWGIFFTAILAALIIIGSRNLEYFDAALVGYTFAVLFSTFALVYRYAMWLRRPPTRLYWRRGWQVFFRRGFLRRNIAQWFRRVIADFALNRFIAERDRFRWAAHWLIMWGCVLAFAITFPLVFGWIHFETLAGNLARYQTYLFGFPVFSFRVHSAIGVIIFHGLVWASFLVIAGVMIAMRRRMRDHGAAAVQKFGEDFLPLILLFAISITGLMLTASYTWMRGYAYEFLAIVHATTVIFTLLWLPFGKFFHIFQRPAQLGVSFYRDIGPLQGMARCARCGNQFASQMHIDDLIKVEAALGYHYSIPTTDNRQPTTHYQQICPDCRRSMLALAQGALWRR